MMRGDRVRKKNGQTFQNGEIEVTVATIEPNGDDNKVWFQETSTWADESFLIVVSRAIEAVEL